MSQLTSSQLVVASATAIQIALQLLAQEGKQDAAIFILDQNLDQLKEYLDRGSNGARY